jgi:hypothetical protein
VPTYAGVTFQVHLDGSWVPEWDREVVITRTLIPGSGKENVQSAGFQNRRIRVVADFTSLADLQTMQGAVGTTLRTLGSFLGATHTAMLTAVRNPRKVYGQGVYRAELEFERFS